MTMDYEAIDREMSKWLVSCTRGKVRFFLTPEGTATDRLDRAARFNDRDAALKAALREREDYAWRGMFAWEPVSRPAASITK